VTINLRCDITLIGRREGAATVGIGAICCFFLPEYPYNAKLLTPLERQVAVYRLEKEAGAGEGSEDIGTWQGFKIGLKDIKVSHFNHIMGWADR
jgi:hypothetical protein